MTIVWSMRLAAVATIAATAAGCLWDTRCVNGAVRDDMGHCVRLDAGVDGSTDAAGGSDASADGAPSDTGADVVAPDAGRSCALGCDPPTPFCRPVDDICVQCLTSANCADPEFPRCDPDSNQCIDCTSDEDCIRFGGTSVCNEAAGNCVQCTSETETEECGPNSCDPVLFRCTTTTRGSLGFCWPCRADSECSSSDGPAFCVPTEYRGLDHGYHCLPESPGGSACGAGSAALLVVAGMGTSIGGHASTYCFPREDLATCEAILDLGDPCGRTRIAERPGSTTASAGMMGAA